MFGGGLDSITDLPLNFSTVYLFPFLRASSVPEGTTLQVDIVHLDNACECPHTVKSVNEQRVLREIRGSRTEYNMRRKDQLVEIIFYLFISLLLGTLAVIGAMAMFPVISLPIAVIYILLFSAHIGLYWLNLKNHPNRRWALLYYTLQTILILTLASFPYRGNGVRISIVGSTVTCLVGEVLGIWGNTRRSLFLVLFYAGLAVVLLFLRVDRNIFGSAVSSFLVNGTFIVVLMIVLNQQFAEREKAQELAESLESANAKLAASAARIESLTLQNERQRMARELHDTLAQGLTGLVLQLEAVRAHLASSNTERAAAIVDQALRRARSTLDESRAAIDDLRLAPVDLGASIRERLDGFTQATGIPCELDLSLRENGFSPEVADHALNILSEALVNVTRHAQAKHVHVRVKAQEDRLELEVHDDGKGFDPQREEEAGHYGLLGMRERARLAGGVLTIESEAGGTRVRFVAPAGGTG